MNSTIRNTRSVCPQCLEPVDAQVIIKDTCVFLQKTCSMHGHYEILLSTSANDYMDLHNYYFSIISNDAIVPEYELWPTYRCNIECNICCFGGQNHEIQCVEPSCSDIETFILKHKQKLYILSGGEPTCRDDLPEIIKVFKRHGKTVTINTNGLRLVDSEYLKNLKNAGLDRINLQFDGFNRQAYKKLRGGDYLDIKLKVLDNLRNMNIPTAFNVTIAKNLNEDEISKLINFAAKNDFINGINFFTICYLGGARFWPVDNYIMPDETIDLLIHQTANVVTKKNIYIFQKLHLAIKAFLKQKWCFYNQSYLFVRSDGSYKPIDNYLNLKSAEPWLDKFAQAYQAHYFWAGIFLLIALVSLFMKFKSCLILKQIVAKSISYFTKTKNYLRGNIFFSVSFSTGCDPYKFDQSIVQNCQNEIIAPSEETNSLVNIGSDGLYCMELERRDRNKKQLNKKINSGHNV